MRYVWMLMDSNSDWEPPELYSSKKRGIRRMEELFEETLDDFATGLTEKEKEAYREQFHKDKKMYFNLYEEVPHGFFKKLLWARTCTLTQEFLK